MDSCNERFIIFLLPLEFWGRGVLWSPHIEGVLDMKCMAFVSTRLSKWLAVFAMMVLSAASSPAYTLIVSPARYSVLQFAFDVLSKTPSVLVSYQGEGAASTPVLHAWNGSEWVLVSMKDYREGNFLQRTPDRVILIGDDTILPASIVESSAWVSDVVRVRELTSSSLVNEFGHILKWSDSEWAWFSKRYNLTLRDESEARRKSSWYDRQGPLPDRPRILERVTQGPAREPAPVPVVPSAEKSAQPVDLIDVPAAESAPVESQPVVASEVAPAVKNPGVDAALDQQTEEALKAFK